MESKRLCLVIPKYQLETATHFNYLYKLISLLDEELSLFLIVERGDKPDFLKKGKAYVLKFRFLPLKLLENFLILMYARMNGYQDFYIHYSFLSAFNASLIAKIGRGRTFYWNCGLPWLYKRSFLREAFENLVYRMVTFLVTGTEGLKREYAKHYQLPLSKIKVMPNWIDVGRFQEKPNKSQQLREQLNIPDKARVILFTHHLSKRKGAHYLPEIVRSLKNENAVLLIAGGGPESENIQSQITNYQLLNKVRFLGCIPNNEIQDYFSIADVFILPSEEEGFPHVLLEAMAAGVPFAAFDVGGVREIIPPELETYLVPEKEVAVFSNKIRELLHKEARDSADLKQSELSWVQQFDIYNARKQFKELLTDVTK